VRQLLLAMALLAAVSGRAESAATIVLYAADGTALSAAWRAPLRQAPGVLLVHMLSHTHTEWDGVADALNAAGFGVLSLDLRGHGGSGGSLDAGLVPLQRDVQAALAWLRSRPELVPGHLGVAGASLGATLAVIGAAGEPAVRSIALLSPAAEFRGVRCDASMRKFAERSGAALLVAGALDPYAARSARQLAAITPGVRELRVIDGTSANGLALVAEHPDLTGALVDWFQKTLL
jgi:alpha-beta hydrolase superfamily lysophospholipase